MLSVRRRLPLLLLVVAAAVVAGLLVLRGGEDDPFAGYCSEVADRREDVGAALSAGATTGLLRALPSFEALADRSPDDIRDDWRLVVTRISDLEDALDDAGVDPAAYRVEDPPPASPTTTGWRSRRRPSGSAHRRPRPRWPASSSRPATSARPP